MKKKNDTKGLEDHLEAHASELVETDDDLEEFISSAKKDNDERRERASYLQSLRRDKLKLSQSELAKAVGANIRTLQGWETGRQDYPKSVEILMTLMRQMPQIKRILMRAKPQKNSRTVLPAFRGKKVLKGKSSRSQSTKKSA
jgi:DNA-binding transcriptional regulator YiaG